MKKASCLGVLILMALILVGPQPAAAHGHVSFGARVYVGPGAWWGPGWWGAPYYYSPPVVVQQPPIYMQSAPAPEEPQYWYYCRKPQGYYPYIRQCPDGWMKVVPPATPPGQ